MIIKKINLIILIIIFAIYEDLIRKFVPGHTPLIFLIKDFLLIIVYTVFLFEFIKKEKNIKVTNLNSHSSSIFLRIDIGIMG